MISNIKKITLINKTFNFGLFLTSILLFSSGCGKNGTSPIASLVNDVAIKTYTQGTDEWINVSITLTTGGFTLAGINLPVINPMNPTVTYGDLDLIPTLCTSNPCNNGGQLVVAVNLTQTTQAQSTDINLPNETQLPVGGLQNATVVALNVAQTGAKIYLAFGQGVAMFGTTVPFAALDPVGKYVPGIDIFEPLTFDKINLIAGIFAGATTNTTGVGLFLDLSSVLNQSTAPKALVEKYTLAATDEAYSPRSRMLPMASIGPSLLTFQPVKPSASKENKLYKKMYDLSKQSLTLNIQ